MYFNVCIMKCFRLVLVAALAVGQFSLFAFCFVLSSPFLTSDLVAGKIIWVLNLIQSVVMFMVYSCDVHGLQCKQITCVTFYSVSH